MPYIVKKETRLMADQNPNTLGDDSHEDEHFEPKGTMVLMIGMVLLFALGWGYVYFGELLARR
jgi:hypothetical protein